MSVLDINEAPVCSFSNGMTVWRVDLKVYTSLQSVVENISCTDPDIDQQNTDLSFSMTSVPASPSYFGLVDSVGAKNKDLRIVQPLSVTQNEYELTITVSDAGTPKQSKNLTLVVKVDCKLFIFSFIFRAMPIL